MSQIKNNNSNKIYWRSLEEKINSKDMPPSTDLSPAQIDSIATWIDQGAIESPSPSNSQ